MFSVANRFFIRSKCSDTDVYSHVNGIGELEGVPARLPIVVRARPHAWSRHKNSSSWVTVCEKLVQCMLMLRPRCVVDSVIIMYITVCAMDDTRAVVKCYDCIKGNVDVLACHRVCLALC